MSVAGTMQRAAQSARRTLGDVARTVTVKTHGAATYNPSTGVSSTPTTVTVPAVLYEQMVHRHDAVPVRRQMALIAARDAAAVNLVPSADATLVDGTTTYRVRGVEEDPARAVYLLELDAPGGPS